MTPRTNFSRTTAGIAGIVILLCGAGWAIAEDKKTGAVERNESSDPVELHLGHVERAKDSIHKEVLKPNETRMGDVVDLVLDLETGNVALVVIEAQVDGQTMFLALPTAIVKFDDKAFHVAAHVTDKSLGSARRIDRQSLDTLFNRAWAALEYTTFGEKPYWQSRTSKGAVSTPPAKPFANNAEYRLTLLSSVIGRSVNDANAGPLGTIEDLALEWKNGLIAYAAFALTDDKTGRLYPLPLGVFVVSDLEQPWICELTRDRVEGTPHFTREAWPTEIDRTWIEYVNVRYGRSPLDGVQHHRHSDKE